MIAQLQNLLRQRQGIATIEFALIFIAMVLMFFATFEVGSGIIVYMKIIDAADTVSDLVAQQTSVASSDFDHLYIAGQLVMQPDTGAGLGLAVASVTFDPNSGNPTVAWQVTRGGGSLMSDAAAAATGLGSKGDSVIVAQVTYTYNSALHYFLPTGLAMSSRVFSRPRLVSSIPCVSPCS